MIAQPEADLAATASAQSRRTTSLSSAAPAVCVAVAACPSDPLASVLRSAHHACLPAAEFQYRYCPA